MGHYKVTCLGCGMVLIDDKWFDTKTAEELLETTMDKRHIIVNHLQFCSNPNPVTPVNILLKP